MREILFRGKRIDDGEWEFGYYVKAFNIYSEEKISIIYNPLCAYIQGALTDFAFVNPETICQYTGLNDKNGKKIFEGDIVTVPGDDELYAVTWDEYTAAWSLNAEALVYTFDNFWGYEVEVVGNVYDNPDWMEVYDGEVDD